MDAIEMAKHLKETCIYKQYQLVPSPKFRQNSKHFDNISAFNEIIHYIYTQFVI